MTLISEHIHKKHGSAIFVCEYLKVKSVSVRDEVEFITVHLPAVVVHSAYKPPTEQFVLLHKDMESYLTL